MSVRIDAKTFYMTGNVAPGFVSDLEDLAHYNIEDALPVNPGDGRSNTSPYSERFCHSGIYRQFPSVKAVVHSHSRDVITVGVSGAEMRPMYHMAGFLGSYVPVFDISQYYDDKAPRNMLVNSNELGQSLASMLSARTSSGKPDYAVVLQRGHGFTTWGESIQEAVCRAVYTQENAKIQMGPSLSNNASQANHLQPSLTPLSDQEIADCAKMNQASAFKAWAYWSRLINANPMYQNSIKDFRDTKGESDYWTRTEGKVIEKES